MNRKTVEKYLTGLRNCKTRQITCENLSHYVGIYPELIAKELTFFDPMVAMEVDYDLRTLIPALEEYLDTHQKKEVKKEPVPQFKVDAKQYKSVADFVYRKMTINGLVDRGANLKENDLKVLKILIQNELDRK